MRFSTLFSVTLLAFGAAKAISIPAAPLSSSEVARRSPSSTDLTERCDTCGTGGGSGPVDVSIIATLNLGELKCLEAVVETFISACVSLTASVKADVIAKLIVWASYSSSELAQLDAALSALITAGVGLTDETFLAILVKADVALDISVAEITCLKAFISAVLTVYVDLAVDVKVKILNWCNSLVSVTASVCLDVKAKILAAINVHLNVNGNVSACVKLRAQLIAYVLGLIKLTLTNLALNLKLVACLAKLNLWLIGSVLTKVDLSICLSIIADLKACGYDPVAALGLDLPACFGGLLQ